jgi:cullin 1
MLFNLFSDDPNGLSVISTLFEQSIAESGLSLVEQQAKTEIKEWEPHDYDPHHHFHRDQLKMQFEYVEELIRMYDLFNHFVANCFRNHSLFEEALKNGFRRILHKDVGTTTNTEIIARFCDYVLNESHELVTHIRRADQAVENYLDKLSALFSYSPDYDLFTFVYRQYLATRLLENRSHSEEAERSMIAKMKIRAGTRFTSRLEGMVNDMAISRQLNKDFQTNVMHRKTSAFSDENSSAEILLWMQDILPVEVKVLTRGIWPPLRDREIRPPIEFDHTSKLFQSFYVKVKQRKILKWAWELGTVTLAMKDTATGNVKHGIIATTLQAMVLCLFNEHETLRLSEICRVLSMDSWIGVRVLHSMCCGKNKVLVKTGNPLVISLSDRFQVNQEFSSTKKFIALPFPDLHEKSVAQASYDYSIPMKAFIVRMMKKEKSMRLSALIDLVMDNLERFRPELKMISAVLDNLVENEYLEKDQQVSDLYHYVP